MHTIIEDKQKELAEICRQYDVVRLEIFGSAARGTDFDLETSDADFLVEFKQGSELGAFQQFFGLADALRNALGRDVDLVEDGAIRNPYLKAAIDKSKEVVYAN